MAKFRRRPAVVWLPNAGAPLLDDTSILITFVHDVGSGAAGRVVSVHPMVPDHPAEASMVAIGDLPTLNDYEGSAYRLRRIVGKCMVAAAQQEDSTANGRPDTIWCTAGFIILRVDPLTGDPVSLASADALYNPQGFGTERDPWIWRRSWTIANQLVADSFNTALPSSNAEYGSVADGPHIDAKTARRISDEERLFFVAATQSLRALGQGTETHPVLWTLDYRVLASMQKNSGNRRNASR